MLVESKVNEVLQGVEDDKQERAEGEVFASLAGTPSVQTYEVGLRVEKINSESSQTGSSRRRRV